MAAAVPLTRILALSGGGVRGIFAAKFMEKLEADLGTQANRQFEIIAGTSTGGIIALALAAGIPAREVTAMYRRHGRYIFRPKTAALFRRGGRYNNTALYEALVDQFKNLRLGDLPVEVVIPTSSLESFAGKVFSRTTDPQASLVDVALATSAAPTYFPAAQPVDSERSYMDGGLWANNPSLLAVLHAMHQGDTRLDGIRLLSIGTGIQPSGTTVTEADKIRTLSPGAIRFILEFLMSTQAWFSDTYTEMLLSHEHFARVNPVLTESVKLDDIDRALDTLPALAELDYDKNKTVLLHLIRRWSEAGSEPAPEPAARAEVTEPAAREHITGLYPSRAYYHTHRGGRPTIDLYIDLAQVSLTMVSVNLATGINMDGILRKFKEMITERDRPVQICVSLPDPAVDHVFETLAPVLDTTADELRQRVQNTFDRLDSFRRQELRPDHRGYLSIRAHRSIPNASAILIDHRTKEGRIQIETKPYKARMQDSFGLEVRHGSSYYDTLARSYQDLMDDGKLIESD